MGRMSKELRPETLDFIYEHVRDAPAQQRQTRDSLDTKMVQIFGAASIVIGLVGVSSGELDGGGMVDALLIAAVTAYVATALITFYGVQVRRFRRSVQADELWNRYWWRKPDEAKHAIVHDVGKAYGHNRGLLRDKARAVRAGVLSAGLEVALVAIALIWSRLA